MKITRMSGTNLGFTKGSTATLQLEITRDDKKKGARIISLPTLIPPALLGDFKYLTISGRRENGTERCFMSISELDKKAA